jgi:3-oxoacyl-[acyl-carrier-protein] synthase-3
VVNLFKASIRSIEVYHGTKVVDNEFYIEHFKKRGKDVEHFLKDIIGRDKRYLIESDEENSLTMAICATRKALDKADLTGADLDMIIFSSQLPEYIAPPSSVHIHNAIGGKQECICYDMNANCAGMTMAFEHVCKYMSVSENIQKVLIVGCDYINMTVDEENENCYGHYGDAACAVILESTQGDSGLIASKYAVTSVAHNNVLFPGCGFSKLFKVSDINQMKIRFKPSEKIWLQISANNIKEILGKNNLTTSDVKMFCFSQYVYKNIEILRSMLGINEKTSLYIGDKYGYTGTTSPFIVLYESLKNNLVKKGDCVVMWALAAGNENIVLLFKV